MDPISCFNAAVDRGGTIAEATVAMSSIVLVLAGVPTVEMDDKGRTDIHASATETVATKSVTAILQVLVVIIFVKDGELELTCLSVGVELALFVRLTKSKRNFAEKYNEWNNRSHSSLPLQEEIRGDSSESPKDLFVCTEKSILP